MPETGTFLSIDPVESEPPYLYTRGNPVNLTDPTGNFPEVCRKMSSEKMYAMCVLSHYAVWPATLKPFYRDSLSPLLLSIGLLQAYNDDPNSMLYDGIDGVPNCYRGPVPYQGHGYVEGWGFYWIWVTGGREVAYDFASMQRREFSVTGGLISDGILGTGLSSYVGAAYGFRSNEKIVDEYGGLFIQGSLGIGAGPTILKVPVGAGGGVAHFGSPDRQAIGTSVYKGVSASKDVPIIDVGGSVTWYSPAPGSETVSYAGTDPYKEVDKTGLALDILTGADRPLYYPGFGHTPRVGAIATGLFYAFVHDEIYIESLKSGK